MKTREGEGEGEHVIVITVCVSFRQREDRVEWLYSGAAGASVNREEYLLGKKIDRFVDPMLVEEEREKEVNITAPLIINND